MGASNDVSNGTSVSNEQWINGVRLLYGEYVSRKRAEYDRKEIDGPTLHIVLMAFRDVCVGAIRTRFYVSEDTAQRMLDNV